MNKITAPDRVCVAHNAFKEIKVCDWVLYKDVVVWRAWEGEKEFTRHLQHAVFVDKDPDWICCRRRVVSFIPNILTVPAFMHIVLNDCMYPPTKDIPFRLLTRMELTRQLREQYMVILQLMNSRPFSCGIPDCMNLILNYATQRHAIYDHLELETNYRTIYGKS